jgi:hypothetical protein
VTIELKNPLFKSIPAAIHKRVVNAFQLTGKALPCHVTAVNAAPSGVLITVQFDVSDIHNLPQITIPLFGPEYIRYPIKATDLGVVMPVDASVAYTSGQSSGISDLSDPANLEALYFMPIGNKNWVSVDPDQVTIYAPNGATIRDTNSGAVIVLHPTEITITVGSSSWAMNSTSVTVTTTHYVVNASADATITAPQIVLDGQMTQGTSGAGYPATLQGPVTVVHEVTAASIPLSTHLHSDAGGTGDSGPPIP